jgi:hypothetical protein
VFFIPPSAKLSILALSTKPQSTEVRSYFGKEKFAEGENLQRNINNPEKPIGNDIALKGRHISATGIAHRKQRQSPESIDHQQQRQSPERASYISEGHRPSKTTRRASPIENNDKALKGRHISATGIAHRK